jgi:hypothetical protein
MHVVFALRMMRHANPQTAVGIYTQSVGANMPTAQGMIDEASRGHASEMAQPLCGDNAGRKFDDMSEVVQSGGGGQDRTADLGVMNPTL